jgi:hypothetical protein
LIIWWAKVKIPFNTRNTIFYTFKPMIRFYKTINPAALFVLPVIVIGLWSQGFFKPQFLIEGNSGVLYSLFFQGFSALPRVVQVILAMTLITFEAIYLNLLLNKYEVLYKASYLPSLFYVLLMSFSTEVISFHPILLVNLLLMRVLDKTFSLFKNDSPISAIFDSCFLLSLCTLIYFPSVVLFLFFIAALAFLRAFNPREWLVAIVAFCLPFYFFGVYAFWTDTLKQSLIDIASQFSFHTLQLSQGFPQHFAIFLYYFLFLFLLAIGKLRANFYKNSIKTRSAQQVLFIFLALAAGASLFNSQIPYVHFTLVAIPACTFLAYFYISAKKRLLLYEVSFLILAGLIIRNYF